MDQNIKKITFPELVDEFYKHNEQNKVSSQFEDKSPLVGAIVFKQGPWFNGEYSEIERTYKFSSDNKYFLPDMCGNSIYASCADGSEKGVRLDYYLGSWEIDYCYIENK